MNVTRTHRLRAADQSHEIQGPRREPDEHEKRLRVVADRVAREWDFAAARCRQERPELAMPARRRALLRLLAGGPLTSARLRELLDWTKPQLDRALYGHPWFVSDRAGGRFALWSLTAAGREAAESC